MMETDKDNLDDGDDEDNDGDDDWTGPQVTRVPTPFCRPSKFV